jgi:hypothetical protein
VRHADHDQAARCDGEHKMECSRYHAAMTSGWVSAAAVGLLTLGLVGGGLARAQVDPDEEAARRHFVRGRVEYAAGRLEAALAEFELARRMRPLPAFDYNIGLVNDRLERWPAALEAYQRYLAGAPRSEDTPIVEARVRVLGVRVAEAARAHSDRAREERAIRLRWAGVGLGVGALGLLAGGAAAAGLGEAAAHDLERRYQQPGAWDATAAALDRRGHLEAQLGAAFLTIGGVFAAAAVVAEVIAATARPRAAPQEPRASR